MNISYFYDGTNKHFAFYRIPKLLFHDKRFSSLSTEAKFLYGMMIDRMELSTKHNWRDKEGHIYIYFTLEEIKAIFHCSNDKAIKLINELDIKHGIGLIESIRQGQGKPNLIYVKNFLSENFSSSKKIYSGKERI